MDLAVVLFCFSAELGFTCLYMCIWTDIWTYIAAGHEDTLCARGLGKLGGLGRFLAKEIRVV